MTGIALYLGGDSWAQLPAKTYSRAELQVVSGGLLASRDVVRHLAEF